MEGEKGERLEKRWYSGGNPVVGFCEGLNGGVHLSVVG